MDEKRPKVVILNSASVDGRLAIAPDKLLLYGDERWQAIEGESDFNVFEWLKKEHRPQATLEGSGSFVPPGAKPEPLPAFSGDPAPLTEDYLPEPILRRPEHRGWFTAVDSRGRIRWMYKGDYPDPDWQGWYPLVLVSRQTPADYLAYLQREEIPYLVAGEEHVDLKQALQKMRATLDITAVLSTAGGRLNGALLRAKLVDEINIEVLPAVIGGLETPSLFDSPELQSDEWPTRLKLISAQVQAGGRIWLRYNIVTEEPEATSV